MYKKISFVFGGLFAMTVLLAAADQETKPFLVGTPRVERYLYKGSVPQGRLYLPATGSNSPVRLAETELQTHLEAIAGKRMEAVRGSAKPDEPGIALAIRPENEWRGKESSQAFMIEEDAAGGQVRIAGNTELAVLYGVYQYLNNLGVRWLTPGELGANIPKLPDIPIRPGKRAYTPSFASRTLALSATANEHFGGASNIQAAVHNYQLYLLRNRTQLGRFAAKGFSFGVCGTGSGHAVKPMTGLGQSQNIISLMEKEPERFALVTGPDHVQKRRYDDGQVCFSNEKNIRTAISNCIAFFEEREKTRNARNTDLDGDATVAIGLSDTSGICECANCANIAGKEPDSKDRLVWSFWNRVARGLNEKMPGRMMAVFSPYMDLTQPPDDVKIESNIMVITPLVFSWEKAPENKDAYPFPKTFLQWVTKTRAAGATLGCYNYLNFPWSPTPLHILDAAQGYAKLGYKHYHVESMQRTEYAWPIVWSLAQFTWDSGKEPREYLKEYCREYFGTPYDREIQWILEEMTRNAYIMERINFGGAADTAYMFPDEFIGQARERLSAAVRGARGKPQERLRRFADAIEAQFQLAETYRAYARALNTRTEEDIADFTKRANGLKEYWQGKNLNVINTTGRTPAVAADLFLKTDFAGLKPSARKELAGKGPQDALWMKELFAGAPVPKQAPNLFPLPEVWKFHLDYDNRCTDDEYFKTEYDDSKGWPAVSSWSMPSSQGYARQVGGYFWYRVRFQAPAFPAGKKVFLIIGSLDDSGDVYLNGVKVGSQPSPYGWDKFFVMDVTQAIRPGEENVLAIHGYDSGGGEGVWRPSGLYTD